MCDCICSMCVCMFAVWERLYLMWSLVVVLAQSLILKFYPMEPFPLLIYLIIKLDWWFMKFSRWVNRSVWSMLKPVLVCNMYESKEPESHVLGLHSSLTLQTQLICKLIRNEHHWYMIVFVWWSSTFWVLEISFSFSNIQSLFVCFIITWVQLKLAVNSIL